MVRRLVLTAPRITVLLLLVPLLSAGQAVKRGQSAEWLSKAFSRRLEASFKYQEAILPVGITTRESYWKVGLRRYLLAELVRLPRDGRLKQDT
jgi:hypothetical protein